MGGVSGNKAAKGQGAHPEVIVPGGHGVIFTPRRCRRSVLPCWAHPGLTPAPATRSSPTTACPRENRRIQVLNKELNVVYAVNSP